MAKQKAPIMQGAPAWIVTFADLMSLLVCFFVLLISFSIQDKEKLQVVAGSMRDAFGVTPTARKAGLVEIHGSPTRDYVKNMSAVERPNDSDFAEKKHNQKPKQGPEANTHDYKKAKIERPRQFALASASLKQAWQEMPEITELSDNIVLEETPEGLHIQLLDQEGRAMFAAGSSKPLAHTTKLLQKMAPVLKAMPNRIKITGHTDSTKLYKKDGYSLWELTADRANTARRILAAAGVPHDKFFSVTGKADTEPLFPEDTFMAANRRVSIVIMNEAPPLPAEHKP